MTNGIPCEQCNALPATVDTGDRYLCESCIPAVGARVSWSGNPAWGEPSGTHTARVTGRLRGGDGMYLLCLHVGEHFPKPIHLTRVTAA